MRIPRKDDKLIVPGFGLMDGEFTFYIKHFNPVRRTVSWDAGLLSARGIPISDFRWDAERQRWVSKDLPLDVEVY